MTREPAAGHRSVDTALVDDARAPASQGLAELLAERLHLAAVTVGADGTIELANRAAQALLTGPAADLVGMPATEALGAHPDVVHALTAARDGVSGTIDLLSPAQDAEPDLRLTFLPVPSGASVLILIEAHASTGAEEDSTHRLAALGRLSAGMAHEIRNPLSGIGTNAQVLRRRFEAGDPRIRFVDFILEEVTRLDKIIEDLLRFARPPEPRLMAHDLRESIERALNLARGRIEKAQVDVRFRVEGEPPSAFVDPDQIAQVLLNVILNAVQAMPDGGELGMGLRSVERLAPVIGRQGRRAGDSAVQGPLRRFLEIEVRDTGKGIDRADLPHLFEPFFTTRPSGTGLGLSTSQALLRQHGGAISVESEQGKGTVVTILIPVEKRRGPR